MKAATPSSLPSTKSAKSVEAMVIVMFDEAEGPSLTAAFPSAISTE
jgi:hypothetical protein